MDNLFLIVFVAIAAQVDAFTVSDWVTIENPYEQTGWNEETIMTRLEAFHQKPEEDASKPRVSTGYRTFNWLVDDPVAKVGYGSRFDILMHTEFHKKPFWTDYDTYQG